MKTFIEYKEIAIELWNKGLVSKSSKTNALRHTSLSFECITDSIKDLLLDCTMAERNTEPFNKLYWGLPSGLHQWREKHSILFSDRFSSQVKEIEDLVELRESIKNTDVIPPVKINSPEDKKEKEVLKSIEEIMETKKIQFLEGYKLAEIMGGLNVYVNSHYVINSYGTQFIRNFFYLNGKLTSLNTICAISCKHKEEYPELYKKEVV